MDTDAFFDFEHAARLPGADDHEAFLPAWSDEQWHTLLAMAVRRVLRPGEHLVREGEQVGDLYIVKTGSLTASVGSGRRRRRLTTASVGSVVGEISFLDGGAASADVVADEESEVYAISRSALEAWGAERPELARDLLLELGRVLALRVRRLTRMVAS